MQAALRDSSMKLEMIDEAHPMRHQVEQYIAERYSSAFDAKIDQFMPQFLALLQEDEIQSICGYRAASDTQLFLEQYLDCAAELAVSDAFSQSVDRSALIEFGQLASFSKGISPFHFYLIARRLVEMEYRWCICTVTDPLYALMKRLGLNPVFISQADAQRVNNAHQWGSYYQLSPRIVAGDLRQSLAHLRRYWLTKGIRIK
ncbi:thermostable hemolysin [Vibrio mangrovi]|uniref:Thermostable hemolysin n=1 Tax=Vibrio mangrovi TaxID=474394 RepID=A0A1Y6J2Q8_9VIBR|nr:thermostable hemolysin [Vibrio mangrovi]MDW6005085.1 thermostable hemolysin [Vibrio mangrovi]SMS02992.1 Thermostable hemolysin [Vibrio mangrovi]